MTIESVVRLGVVPAHAGTHTPRLRLFGAMADGFCSNKRRWLMGWTAPYGIDEPE
jgi:hypothetical protein